MSHLLSAWCRRSYASAPSTSRPGSDHGPCTYLPNATNHPDAPPNLEPALLKLFGKTGDDISQDESGARYFNVSFEDTCLPSNTITVAKLDQSMKLHTGML